MYIHTYIYIYTLIFTCQDDVGADPSAYALRGWRAHTPGRMGFAGDLLGEMAYYTNLVPSTLRQQQVEILKRQPVAQFAIENDSETEF